jgi:hypothetical protein
VHFQESTLTRCMCALIYPQDLIVYAVITVCDVGSLALCCVLAIVSLYYLILYKLQVGRLGTGRHAACLWQPGRTR